MEAEKYLKLLNFEKKEEFDKLYTLLTECNKLYNLTSIVEKDEVFIKHFLDSVLGEKYIPNNSSVIEIGSGGGFPSLPLKILREDLSFTLLESTLKKCVYLENCVKELNLNAVKVINCRAEELGKNLGFRQKYDVAVARAVARLNTLCEYCMPFVKVGGRFIAYKGCAADEIEEAKNAISTLGGKIEIIDNFTLPNGDGRTLVVIEKIKNTPEKYPRGQGKERKNPL